MANIIKQHNNKIINKEFKKEVRPCNCRNKQNCPLGGNCLATNIVYKADVVTSEKVFTYYGTSESEFKYRYNNHTKSFRNRTYQYDSELSKLIWKLKDDNTQFDLNWSIAVRASPYICGSRRCDLCLCEKICIIKSESKELLNKRNELISKCRHRNKYIIGNVK